VHPNSLRRWAWDFCDDSNVGLNAPDFALVSDGPLGCFFERTGDGVLDPFSLDDNCFVSALFVNLDQREVCHAL